MKWSVGKWSRGPVSWVEDDHVCVSVVFTWDMGTVLDEAVGWHNLGYRVSVGGPGVFVKTPEREELERFALRRFAHSTGIPQPSAIIRLTRTFGPVNRSGPARRHGPQRSRRRLFGQDLDKSP